MIDLKDSPASKPMYVSIVETLGCEILVAIGIPEWLNQYFDAAVRQAIMSKGYGAEVPAQCLVADAVLTISKERLYLNLEGYSENIGKVDGPDVQICIQDKLPVDHLAYLGLDPRCKYVLTIHPGEFSTLEVITDFEVGDNYPHYKFSKVDKDMVLTVPGNVGVISLTIEPNLQVRTVDGVQYAKRKVTFKGDARVLPENPQPVPSFAGAKSSLSWDNNQEK